MRNTLVFTLIVLTSTFLSCQDSTEAVPASSPVAEYRNVGMEIPTDMGARWIEAYQRTKGSGRLGLLYNVGSDELNAVISSVDDLVGVAFHYGIDDAGTTHLILIPVDDSMRLWTSSGGRVYLDGNTNTIISKDTALSWAANYKQQNPDGIWFHFFGSTVFNDIQSVAGFSEFSIVPAMNDLDLSPELLLVVGNIDGLILGRTASEPIVYDASYPCPRCEVM